MIEYARRLFGMVHRHRATRFERSCQWVYEECSCHARRTSQVQSRGYTAKQFYWPKPDGQWHDEPEGGWPTSDLPLPVVPPGPAPGGTKPR